MGRHSRRGPADGAEEAVDIPAAPEAHDPSRAGSGTGRRRRVPADAPPVPAPAPAPPSASGRTPASGHTSARPGTGQVRGGHPEPGEPGGGWGAAGGRGASVPRVAGPVTSVRGPEDGHGVTVPAEPALPGPRPRQGRPDQGRPDQGRPRQERLDQRHPRQEYLDAFDAPAGADPYARVTEWDAEPPAPPEDPAGEQSDDGGREKRGKGMTFTGIAAAAVTAVLAVVVAGQVTDKGDSARETQSQAAEGARVHGGSASRTDERAAPKETAQAAPATYGQKMAKKYPLAADLKASGAFTTIPGTDKAPGSGQKFRYRVDVEKGLGLDGKLFAQAVQKTLNDKRSWAHDDARTFERISSGKPDFVISLASPGTTADWCEKSGLDTTQDNVSCDSAATDRVMINAYRWAQGSKTYDKVLGDHAIYPYRQMLINHEVGHRLGFNHVTCSQDGALAPVMQQQTKFLTSEGITCKPNPWAFPKG
ncbi:MULTISPECIES: DUF3152 domain-containing protein [unclassified Streptomyces]|uniref:DUF3152 domain-containing protein n=1 Tax=unclassified Streptomyces TaxID=2593676 RepID=UPI00278BDCAE|nr:MULTISPECIES: DUF3152 domain-containing protein [unclassified Streptomyces]